MKRIAIILLSMIPLFAFNACDQRDDIQADVDALNARLDELNTQLEALNASINALYDVAMLQGNIYVTGYSKNEKGDYTLSLSNGDNLIVYGGQPAEEIPAMGFREENGVWYWTYTLDGVTYDLLDEKGNPVQASPTDGKDGETPAISVQDGRWGYTIGGGEWTEIPGNYGIADANDIPNGVFANVKSKDDNANILVFTYGDDELEVALLGGLDMTFATQDTPSETVKDIIVQAGGEDVTLNATLTKVEKVIIDPTPLEVKLDETADPEGHTVTVTAPAGLEAGTYIVYFQIFSEARYRLIVPLEVEVMDAGA